MRDEDHRALELALDADHKILGMKVQTTANLGAYSSLFGPFIPTGAALKVLPGVYDVKSGSEETALDGTRYSDWE